MTGDGSTYPCPSCGTAQPPGSRFCPQCGTRLAAGETLELSPEPVKPDPAIASDPPMGQLPPSVHQVHRQPLGIHPLPLLGAAAILALLVAIILLAGVSLAGGLIVLGLAVASLTLFLGGVRREPDAPTARLTLRAADRARSLARLGAVAARAWARAGIDLLRIRRRQHRLRSELQARLTPLGEAVYNEDQQGAEALKRQAAELEQKLHEAEREAAAVFASTRRKVEHERAPIEPTEPLAPAETSRTETGA